MFDKVILGVYKDKLYQKQDVRESKMFYNYYVFDMSEGCVFIAERVTNSCRPLGNSLYDIMSPEQVNEVISHMKSYTETPMFVRTSAGIALLLPHLAPCASLGILVFPHFGGDHLLRIYKHKRWQAVYGTGIDALNIRYSKNSVKYTPLAETLTERINDALGWMTSAFATDMCGDITPHLEDRLYAISYFTGCPIGILCKERIEVLGEFDFPMFVVFVLIMSTIAVRVSPNSELSACLSKPDNEPEIRMDFLSDGHDLRRDSDMQALKRIIDRKRMCIVPLISPEVIHCKFYPTVKDWALLGIKSPCEAQPISHIDT